MNHPPAGQLQGVLPMVYSLRIKRMETPPDYKELDLALTAIVWGPEWRSALNEAYQNGG